jgi:hypothetical protein
MKRVIIKTILFGYTVLLFVGANKGLEESALSRKTHLFALSSF